MISILSYFIVFDKSVNANTHHTDIALRPVGFRSEYIEFPAVFNESQKQPFFSKLIYGDRYPNSKIFFKSMRKEGNQLLLTLHNGRQRTIEIDDTIDMANLIDTHLFLLGTDKFGRSIASRIILGIRVSIFVGLLAVLVSLSVGIILGLLSGFFGGVIDSFIIYLINVTWSLPTLLLVFAIVMVWGRGLTIIFVAVGLTMWVEVARIVRGQTLRVKEEQYIKSANSLGFRWYRILTKHVLPNLIGPVLVIAAANFATAILIEAGLSFLGFGIKPPAPSLGNILNEHYGYAMAGRYALAFIPAFIIMILVLSFNLIGSGLRDILDVKN